MPYHWIGCCQTTSSRRAQRGLLGGDVDQVVGVERVQVAHLDAPAALGAAARAPLHQAPVDARLLQLRVGDEDEDSAPAGVARRRPARESAMAAVAMGDALVSRDGGRLPAPLT